MIKLLNQSEFWGCHYKYDVQYITCRGRVILYGGSTKLSNAQEIAKQAVLNIFESPFQKSNLNKYKTIDSIGIYDSDTDEQVTPGSFQEFVERYLSKLVSKMTPEELSKLN